MVGIEKAFILADPKRRGCAMSWARDAWGNNKFYQEAAERGNHTRAFILWFLWKGTGKAGSTNLGMASWIVSAPGDIKQVILAQIERLP